MMVLLTSNYVEKECSRVQSLKSLTKEIPTTRLKKISHLRMNDKFISAIGDLSIFQGLRVIYLHNNNLSKIENLNFAVHLTHLYLQHNELTKIENLDCLENLVNLFLGHNCITVVEGLEKLEKLRELHVEKQRLIAGEYLMFEPRTVRALSNRLVVLNVAGNRMNSLRSVGGISGLEILDARDNLIEDMEDLTDSISSLWGLRKLLLQGNPVTRVYRYRENVIANTTEFLVNLDGKSITDVCRRFMKKFKQETELRQNRRRSKMTLSDDITSSLKLPPAFERSVSRAIIQQHPGPKFNLNVTSASIGSQPQIFPAWKSSAAATATKSNTKLAPRPFLRGIINSKQTLKKTVSITDPTVFPAI